MSGPDELKAFETRIGSLAEPHLSAGKPALISALGLALGADLQRLKAISGLSLREFVLERMADRYRIIEVKQDTSALWKIDVPYTGETVEGKKASANKASNFVKAPRYEAAFWQAFAVPLTAGRRFYDLDAQEVRNAEVAATPDWIEIEPEFIRPANEPYETSTISGRVAAWIKQHGLGADVGTGPRSSRLESRPAGRSVLEALISSLDRRQQQATTLSLDVVAALMQRTF